jgi:hypothetical protein
MKTNHADAPPGETLTAAEPISEKPVGANSPLQKPAAVVTMRAFVLGVLLTVGVAWLNSWVESLYDVHFVGGIQMPFISIFLLTFFILAFNWPLRALHAKAGFLRRVAPLFSPAELLTIYVMTLFGALISTPGCDTIFLSFGPALFYFSSAENGWATLFYKYVPSWYAPGWDGQKYQQDIINQFFLGGLDFSQIPWHAWTAMLIAWSTFMFLIYALLFFTALLFRRQWVEYEALTFPLVEVPMAMAATDDANGSTPGLNLHPPSRAFWGNRMMWAGFAIAAFFHIFKGMNAYYPDWPVPATNIFNGITLAFTEKPWDAIPPVTANLYWGAIGLAYLLTREVSFSFWFFFVVMLFQYAFAQMLGFPTVGLGKSGIMGRPDFLIYQSIGGWAMMALMLTWAARSHLRSLVRAAFSTNSKIGNTNTEEPFSPRFILLGFVFSLTGLLAWTHFAGINLLFAAVFLGIFLITSLVLTRLVIEGGFLFPQAPYLAREWMTVGMFGAPAIGASNLTKLAFIEPTILYDMRTNVLPAFLHTMKIADSLEMDNRNQRRLMGAGALAIVITFAVTICSSLFAIYSNGGLVAYSAQWGKTAFAATADLIKTGQPVEPMNIGWMAVGALILWMLVTARSRLLWFPFHPLGFLAATAYPITQLWFSFFAGWLTKTLIMKYGGASSANAMRPFMIGLILGNITAMVFWMLIGFKGGTQIGYWPA